MAKAAKKQEEMQAVTPIKSALPAEVSQAAWGSEGVDNSDIIVPKLLVMQGLSQLVADGQASVGQIRDSLEGKLLGGWDASKKAPVPVEFIVFQSFKTWVEFQNLNGKDEFKAQYPMTPENMALPLEEMVGGIKIRRDKALNFYVLIPSEIAGGAAFPYLLTVRRTSYKAGKKLITTFAKLRSFKKPVAAKVMTLLVAQQENEKGKFFVFDVATGRDSTDAEMNEAYRWYKTFQTAKVTVDNSDLKTEAPAPVAAGSEEFDV